MDWIRSRTAFDFFCILDLCFVLLFFFFFLETAVTTEEVIVANMKTDVKGWHHGVCSLMMCISVSYLVSDFMIGAKSSSIKAGGKKPFMLLCGSTQLKG